MARAMTEKTNTGYLLNHTASSAVTSQLTCTRCGGLMVNEFYMDLPDHIGESKSPAKRCVQCGEVVDFVILLNRQQPMTTLLAREMSSHNRIAKGQ